MTFQYLYETCVNILEGLTRFGENTLNWMFTAKQFNFGVLVGTIEVTPFEVMIETFFTVAVARIVLNFSS